MQPKIKLLILAMLLATANLFGQSASPGAGETQANYSHRAQVIYGEFGGSGPLLSINYDFRFTKSQKGLGMRLGLGFFRLYSGGVSSVPVAINHLAGKAPNYFESSIGVTYATLTEGDGFLRGSGGSFLVPGIGYRYQPENNGFFGRIAISPLIVMEEGGVWIPWGGIGLGYKF